MQTLQSIRQNLLEQVSILDQAIAIMRSSDGIHLPDIVPAYSSYLESYPADSTAPKKIRYAISKTGRFAHKREIEAIIKEYDPEIPEYWVSQKISNLVKKGGLQRVKINDSRMNYYYGFDSWVEVDQGNNKTFASEEVKPPDTVRYEFD